MCRTTVYENGVVIILVDICSTNLNVRICDDSVKILYHSLELSSIFVSLRGRNLGLFTQDYTLMSTEEGALSLFGICDIGQTANSWFLETVRLLVSCRYHAYPKLIQ